jgi:hypothetical protein
MKNVDIVVKIGAKEIVALCVGVPLMYKKLRDIKLKYDVKEKAGKSDADTIIFSDVIIDQNGTKWRKEV